ncbi:hypothetical protein DL764_001448 [Monosporascus ibericus]|uniref:Uncharacterized protein n=1 Tax=Monosporascus ibericus TaxID=155417 RepID=A0A4Q4TSZ1_9PEZI|nr:hypothetical protein DL764_001448 [Monosporascus ibericus]
MTIAESFFSLPSELLASLAQPFPCREPQIRTLATLVHPRAAAARNLIVHGAEATGKSAITAGLLAALHGNPDPSTHLDYVIVRSAECVTARHLFERTVGAVTDALDWNGPLSGRCETLAALTVELGRMLEKWDNDNGGNRDARRFVLVFDGIDRQREAPPTLLPALARLSEIIPNLTTIFILTAPSASLRVSGTPMLHFAPYTKNEYITIMKHLGPPAASLPNTTPQETADLWARFAAAVHDSLIKPAGPRTLPALRQACAALWPRFTAPVAAGTHRAKEFSRLLVAARVLFQDEGVLQPGIMASARPRTNATSVSASAGAPLNLNGGPGAGAIIRRTPSSSTAATDLAGLLPPTPRLLLIAAYLASHNAPRHDQTLFSTWYHGRKRRRGGRRRGTSAVSGGGNSNPGTPSQARTPRGGGSLKHRKIARKLLGPGAFVLERMVAIYVATRREWVDDGSEYSDSKGGGMTVDGDVGMAIATLASLRLLVRVGGGAAGGAGAGGMGGGADLDRGGKWRVNVSWEVIRALGRSMGVEVEEWLID